MLDCSIFDSNLYTRLVLYLYEKPSQDNMVPIRLCDDTICNLRTIQILLSLSKSCKDICEYICFLYEQMLKRSPHDKILAGKSE